MKQKEIKVKKSSNGFLVEITCLKCLQKTWIKKNVYERNKTKFCSHKCYTDFYNLKKIVDSQIEPMKNKTRYSRCEIGKKYTSFHRTVYEFFYGKIPDGFCIHHIDENKLNNDILNLELMTNAEHTKHHIKPKKGSECYNSKLEESQVEYIRNLYKKGYKQSNIAFLFQVSKSTINLIVNRKSWKHI